MINVCSHLELHASADIMFFASRRKIYVTCNAAAQFEEEKSLQGSLNCTFAASHFKYFAATPETSVMKFVRFAFFYTGCLSEKLNVFEASDS
jgi:hypothetical protein